MAVQWTIPSVRQRFIPFENFESLVLSCTYPKICGTRVKIQLQGLSWSTNADLAKVHGIILNIFGWNIACLAVYFLLQGTVNAGPATNRLLAGSGELALLLDVRCVKVGAIEGGVEPVLAQEVDI